MHPTGQRGISENQSCSFPDNQLAIGVAISTNPFGPYKDYGKPIIEMSPGAIDIHYFKDPK